MKKNIFYKNNMPTIKVVWKLMKGVTEISESLDRALTYVWLIGDDDRFFVPVTIVNNHIEFTVPTGIVVGNYGVKAVWVKDCNNFTENVDANVCYKNCLSEIHDVFAVTDYQEEGQIKKNCTITLVSNVATYGYDGLDAYEIACMRGKTTLKESLWIASAEDMSQKYNAIKADYTLKQSAIETAIAGANTATSNASTAANNANTKAGLVDKFLNGGATKTENLVKCHYVIGQNGVIGMTDSQNAHYVFGSFVTTEKDERIEVTCSPTTSYKVYSVANGLVQGQTANEVTPYTDENGHVRIVAPGNYIILPTYTNDVTVVSSVTVKHWFEGAYAAEKSFAENEAVREANESERIAQASSDHSRAESDHSTATGDHSIAAGDHSTATGDHSTATSDHSTATSDHSTATADSQQASSDHTASVSATSAANSAATSANQAAQETRLNEGAITDSAGDNTRWGKYYSNEGDADSSTAGDGTRWGVFKSKEAARDAAISAVTEYETKVDDLESDVTDLAQKVDSLDFEIDGTKEKIFNVIGGTTATESSTKTAFVLSKGKYKVSLETSVLPSISFCYWYKNGSTSKWADKAFAKGNTYEIEFEEDVEYIGFYCAGTNISADGTVGIKFTADSIRSTINSNTNRVSQCENKIWNNTKSIEGINSAIYGEANVLINVLFGKTADITNTKTEIHLKKGTYTVLVNSDSLSSLSLAWFYVGTSEATYYSKAIIPNTPVTIILNNDINYIAFYSNNIKKNGTVEIKFDGLGYFEQIEEINTKTKIITTSYNEFTNLIDKSKCIHGYYVDWNGKLKELDGRVATDFIELKEGVKYYRGGTIIDVNEGIGYSNHAFYAEDKETVLRYTDSTDKLGNPFTIPTGAKYARFTILEERLDNAWLSTANFTGVEDNGMLLNQNIVAKPYLGKNCDYIGDEVVMFNKCLCIGESLTEGFLNEDSGSKVIRQQYSYPSLFSKITGINVTNWGKSGYTSPQWYEEFNDSEHDWSGYDMAIVWLGGNDAMKLGGWTEASITAFTGIINRLKTDNHNIKIYVCTFAKAQSYYGANFDAVSQGIRNLVASFNDDNIVLIDLAVYSHTADTIAMNAGHFSAYGYLQLAKDLKAAISYHIRTNPQFYRFVQFIGTNYVYTPSY